MLFSHLVPAALCVASAAASPLVPDRGLAGRGPISDIILEIAPGSASCTNASFPEECRTAEEAAPFIRNSMMRHGIYSRGELAALLSLMAFETGDFKFNRNHFPEPGRPGQGTRNLQMINFNLLYALDIPELHDQAVAIATAGGNGNDTIPEGEDLTDEQKNEILELVLPDDYTWGSAAWFLTTQCDYSIREGLSRATLEGLTDYLENCVGTTAAEERIESWENAKVALGLPHTK